ncbi:zinc finger protein 134-like [Bacillus rossius redtenbacheri]|uniref:zinc finger protein 134-like n=1 Tax=Bacillus rossius redtenbacheri TaxID=93214 RepID=UPI002FDE8E80
MHGHTNIRTQGHIALSVAVADEVFAVDKCWLAGSGPREAAARPYRCRKCRRAFCWKHSLVRHENSVCGSSLHLGCPFCSYVASRRDTLLRHVTLMHPELAAPRDDSSGHSRAEPDAYYEDTGTSPPRPVLAGRPGDGRYACGGCHKVYRYKRTLQRHRKHECGRPPRLQCPDCPYVCRYRTDLLKHMARRHGYLPGWPGALRAALAEAEIV